MSNPNSQSTGYDELSKRLERCRNSSCLMLGYCVDQNTCESRPSRATGHGTSSRVTEVPMQEVLSSPSIPRTTLNIPMPTPIADRDGYCNRMFRSIADKLFWVDKIDAEVIVDYGCADGALIATVQPLMPEQKFIGFDQDPEMIKAASARGLPNVTFTGDWSKATTYLGARTALIVSSVHHEAHNYLSQEDLLRFGRRIWGMGWSTVVFRDMMVSRHASRPSDPVSAIRIRQLNDPRRLDQWEARWGSITENWSLLHFLLTYRYIENWEREYQENYLPIPLEDFLQSLPRDYHPIYYEHYILPFLRRQVRQDFGITVPDPTHLKLIMEYRR